ncbi:hypothetical protein SAMN05880501_11320 [Ureibacillus xyleni]|uniref:Uncharacterized protein n=1 Tax=Ureibacillus xyleni TaxID=614648 RepID=A0A285THP8_9BACL|nr:hypothetical protein [Ureibacillus xyleni]SOC21572.1 hypothetical protein SAMN05880501_11320 [Ureibacillus xyleni]
MQVNQQQIYAMRMHFYYEELISEKEHLIAILEKLMANLCISIEELQTINRYFSELLVDCDRCYPIDFEQQCLVLERQLADSRKEMKTNLEREGIQLP